MKAKNYSIEFLRVVFTIYIVLRHTLAASGIYRGNCLWLGVEFFFVLSGFLLVETFRPERSTCEYVVNRYLRFAPLTMLGCILCAFFAVPNPVSLVANVLLISETGIVVGGGGAPNPPTWYLSVLLWGGALYLLLFKCCRAKYLLLALVVLLGLSSLRKYGYEPVHGEIAFCGISHRFVRGIAEMGLGCLCAVCCAGKWPIAVSGKAMDCLELGSLCLAIAGPFAPIWQYPACISVLVINDALLITLFARRAGGVSRFLDVPLWGRISQYALALFCTHYVTTLALLRWGVRDSIGAKTVSGLIALFVAIGLAVVARKWVEIPCARFVQNRILIRKD